MWEAADKGKKSRKLKTNEKKCGKHQTMEKRQKARQRGTKACLLVCGISLKSGQLITELFLDCLKGMLSHFILRSRDGDGIYEMRCLFVAVGPLYNAA